MSASRSKRRDCSAQPFALFFICRCMKASVSVFGPPAAIVSASLIFRSLSQGGIKWPGLLGPTMLHSSDQRLVVETRRRFMRWIASLNLPQQRDLACAVSRSSLPRRISNCAAPQLATIPHGVAPTGMQRLQQRCGSVARARPYAAAPARSQSVPPNPRGQLGLVQPRPLVSRLQPREGDTVCFRA